MDRDYQLGKDFSECAQKVRPDNQQRLLALLGDFAGSDHDIISAFRLLFGNHLYVSLFIESSQVSLAQISSLVSIAEGSLSPVLAGRAESFVRGYFGVAMRHAVSPSVPSQAPQKQSNKQAEYASKEVPGHAYAFNQSEESTLFADDELHEEETRKPTGTNASHLANTFNPKPLLLAVLIVFSCVALFKVPAICEPFGLCDKKEEKEKKEPPKSRSANERRESGVSDQPSPDVQQVQPTPLAAPASPPYPNSAPPVVAPQPVRTPAPQADSAPLRDEPLW